MKVKSRLKERPKVSNLNREQIVESLGKISKLIINPGPESPKTITNLSNKDKLTSLIKIQSKEGGNIMVRKIGSKKFSNQEEEEENHNIHNCEESIENITISAPPPPADNSSFSLIQAESIKVEVYNLIGVNKLKTGDGGSKKKRKRLSKSKCSKIVVDFKPLQDYQHPELGTVCTSRGISSTLGSMNINGPPIMDMSMNPNGYHQPYLPPTMMPPPPPHNVTGGPPHHNEGQMSVGPPQQQQQQQQQQQPPPAHPPQQQSQSQNQSGGGSNSGGGNSNPGSASGGENVGGGGSGNEGSGSPSKPKAKSWPKKKVYKKPDPNAPKQRRFSGYYVYMRERRDQLRSMYPEMPFYEIIRQLAQEWNNMDREVKQKYLDSAEADKQNYEREMSAYKKTEQYKTMNKRKKKNQAPGNQSGSLDMSISGANSMSTANNSSYNSSMMSSNLPGSSAMNMMNRPSHINHDTGMEIPIFTEEFLEHNKDMMSTYKATTQQIFGYGRYMEARELELRALRKTVTECEEQNATLQKHVEQMQQEIERMEHEMRQQKLQNEMLSQNLNRLRSVLASSFASLPLPGTHEPPNIHTIDKYMNEVKAMQEANSVHFAPFLNRVKDIISRLEL